MERPRLEPRQAPAGRGICRHPCTTKETAASWFLAHASAGASAFNYVFADAKATWWAFRISRRHPGDTEHQRHASGQGQLARVQHEAQRSGHQSVCRTARPAPQRPGRHAAALHGELMRGFGLLWDGLDRFHTTQSVDLAASPCRAPYTNAGATGVVARHFTKRPTRPAHDQGGASAGNPAWVLRGASSAIVTRERGGMCGGDTADSWVAKSGDAALWNDARGGPQVTVLGTPGSSGAMIFAGKLSMTASQAARDRPTTHFQLMSPC